MRWSLVLATIASLLIVPTISALKLDGLKVILPIIGRFPGAESTQWRTDVFIENHSSVAKSANLTFHVAGGSPMTFSVSLAPYSTAILPDIVLNTFGLSNAAGQLEIDSSNTSNLEARARIYNSGNPAGEFGQNVPGIGLGDLSRQSSLYGLSATTGDRVNIGVANPNGSTATVQLRIADKDNGSLASDTLTIGPHQTMQINDIVAHYGIAPQAGIQVEFNAVSTTENVLIYGYASQVRNDTGDAIFVVGTSPNA